MEIRMGWKLPSDLRNRLGIKPWVHWYLRTEGAIDSNWFRKTTECNFPIQEKWCSPHCHARSSLTYAQRWGLELLNSAFTPNSTYGSRHPQLKISVSSLLKAVVTSGMHLVLPFLLALLVNHSKVHLEKDEMNVEYTGSFDICRWLRSFQQDWKTP